MASSPPAFPQPATASTSASAALLEEQLLAVLARLAPPAVSGLLAADTLSVDTSVISARPATKRERRAWESGASCARAEESGNFQAGSLELNSPASVSASVSASALPPVLPVNSALPSVTGGGEAQHCIVRLREAATAAFQDVNSARIQPGRDSFVPGVDKPRGVQDADADADDPDDETEFAAATALLRSLLLGERPAPGPGDADARVNRGKDASADCTEGPPVRLDLEALARRWSDWLGLTAQSEARPPRHSSVLASRHHGSRQTLAQQTQLLTQRLSRRLDAERDWLQRVVETWEAVARDVLALRAAHAAPPIAPPVGPSSTCPSTSPEDGSENPLLAADSATELCEAVIAALEPAALLPASPPMDAAADLASPWPAWAACAALEHPAAALRVFREELAASADVLRAQEARTLELAEGVHALRRAIADVSGACADGDEAQGVTATRGRSVARDEAKGEDEEQREGQGEREGEEGEEEDGMDSEQAWVAARERGMRAEEESRAAAAEATRLEAEIAREEAAMRGPAAGRAEAEGEGEGEREGEGEAGEAEEAEDEAERRLLAELRDLEVAIAEEEERRRARRAPAPGPVPTATACAATACVDPTVQRAWARLAATRAELRATAHCQLLLAAMLRTAHSAA